MKRLLLVWVMILCVFLMTACAAISQDVIRPTSASFDMKTDGLVQVQTVHESDKTVKYYALASGSRIMDTDTFVLLAYALSRCILIVNVQVIEVPY